MARACEVFARSGLPVGPDVLEALIAVLRRTEGGRARLAPAGAAKAGERGGRGKALYPARVLMELHRDFAPWITPPGTGLCIPLPIMSARQAKRPRPQAKLRRPAGFRRGPLAPPRFGVVNCPLERYAPRTATPPPAGTGSDPPAAAGAGTSRRTYASPAARPGRPL